MADAKGVLIIAETQNGSIAPIAQELLGVGRKLADALGEELCAAIPGCGLGTAGQDAIAHGADKAYVIDDAVLEKYQNDAYVPVLESLAKEMSPRIILLGQTAVGRDLAPRLAFRLGTAIGMDCVDLSIDADKNLVQTRPCYGGNAMATQVVQSSPQMATVRPKAVEALPKDSSRKGEVIARAAGVDASAIRAKVQEVVIQQAEGIKLEDAAIVVAGGRGIGGPEGFEQLEQLAKALGAAVGASRPVCDSGWRPASIQVGLTGKVVSPSLYIAIAISGAAQHMSGMSGSRNIVCVNRDPDATMFKAARWGVVGDWKEFLPAFTAKVRELKGA